jgi:hypothetical protein
MGDAREVVIFDTSFSRDADKASGDWSVACRACGWTSEGVGPESEAAAAIESHRRGDHPNAWVPSHDDLLGYSE